jgi:Protein of unknown function (DUF2799)
LAPILKAALLLTASFSGNWQFHGESSSLSTYSVSVFDAYGFLTVMGERLYVLRGGVALFLRNASLCGAILLSGCASMSKDECLYANWQAIGYEDGAAGKPISAVSSRRTACAKKAGVTIDMMEYRIGRKEGLTVYCRPSRGYSVGEQGGYYYGVCAEPGENEFIAAYEAGRRLYAMERTVTALAGDIRQAHYDFNEIEHNIARMEAGLVAPDTPGVDRVNLLMELKQLSEDKSNIEILLTTLNRDHARAQQDILDYKDRIAFGGPVRRPATIPMQANY